MITLSKAIKYLNINITLKDNQEFDIISIDTINNAKKNYLTFFHNIKYEKYLSDTEAGAILVKKEYVNKLPNTCFPIITEEPYADMARLSKLFKKPFIENKSKNELIVGKNVDIMPNVYIGSNVTIGNDVIIMPNSFIGDYVTIGDNTLIYPNVSIYRDCIIGSNCIIHAGTVIGSDGFGFAHTQTGEHIKIYQNGNVIIENDVEIGANSTVDRAVFGSTIVKSGTKIDNLVQIGHNCVIGENSIIVSQTGLSGSTILGRNVIMGGQSGTAGHLEIGSESIIAARGGVTKSLKGKTTYAGFPLMEHKEWLKLQAKILKLIKD